MTQTLLVQLFTALRLPLLIVALVACIEMRAMEQPHRLKRQCMERMPEMSANASSAERELICGAVNGDFASVLKAIKAGADIDTSSSNKRTALHWAAYNGNVKIVEALLYRDALIDLIDNKGLRPLHLAAAYGHVVIVRLLLESGANIDVATRTGDTALHMAAEQGRDSVVKFLLKKGARINSPNADGETPLMIAARSRNVHSVQMLLDLPQTDIDATNIQGQTSLDMVLKKDNDAQRRAIAQLLMSHGARATAARMINLIAKKLPCAAALGNLNEVEDELSRLQNATGTEKLIATMLIREALLYAVGRGHVEIVRRLLATQVNVHSVISLVEVIRQRLTLSPADRDRYEVIRGLLNEPSREVLEATPPSATEMRLSLRDNCDDSGEIIMSGEVDNQRLEAHPEQPPLIPLFEPSVDDVSLLLAISRQSD